MIDALVTEHQAALLAAEEPAHDTLPRGSIAQARRALAAAFRAAGLATPELDARVLVGHALALDHAALAAQADRALAGLRSRCRGRARGAPARPRTGRAHRWRQGILGSPARRHAATLVPRPETETVVEAALAAIDAAGPRARRSRIADLGTGSGALLLALLHELPHAFGVGTDVSVPALAHGARQCRAAWLSRHGRASWRAISARRWRRRIRSRRVKSALCRKRRHRGAAARSRDTILALRSMAAPTVSAAYRAIAADAAAAQARRPSCAGARRRPGRRGRRAAGGGYSRTVACTERPRGDGPRAGRDCAMNWRHHLAMPGEHFGPDKKALGIRPKTD